jgi:hypothetical protein
MLNMICVLLFCTLVYALKNPKILFEHLDEINITNERIICNQNQSVCFNNKPKELYCVKKNGWWCYNNDNANNNDNSNNNLEIKTFAVLCDLFSSFDDRYINKDTCKAHIDINYEIPLIDIGVGYMVKFNKDKIIPKTNYNNNERSQMSCTGEYCDNAPSFIICNVISSNITLEWYCIAPLQSYDLSYDIVCDKYNMHYIKDSCSILYEIKNKQDSVRILLNNIPDISFFQYKKIKSKNNNFIDQLVCIEPYNNYCHLVSYINCTPINITNWTCKSNELPNSDYYSYELIYGSPLCEFDDNDNNDNQIIFFGSCSIKYYVIKFINLTRESSYTFNDNKYIINIPNINQPLSVNITKKEDNAYPSIPIITKDVQMKCLNGCDLFKPKSITFINSNIDDSSSKWTVIAVKDMPNSYVVTAYLSCQGYNMTKVIEETCIFYYNITENPH